MTHDPLKDGDASERWCGQEVPLTPQAEEAMLTQLHAQALVLLGELQTLKHLEDWQAACVKLLAVHLPHGEHNYSLALARTLAQEPQDRSISGEVSHKLASTLKEARALEMGAPLASPLGQKTTPSAFMAHLKEHPEELVQELLAVGDDGPSPEESLHGNIQKLRETFLLWTETPSVQTHYAELHSSTLQALTSLVVGLSRLGEALRRDYLALLRWRLERCDDLLALPEAWHLPHWQFDLSHMFFSSAVRLTTTLWRRTTKGGRSSLSPSTWDAVFSVLMELMAQADEVAMDISAKIEIELMLEVERMDAEVDTVARLLVDLEREGLSGLPQEMRETFVRNALYRGVAEGLVGVLQEVDS